ncbi:MAG: FAD-dependent 5-carboxymethylaminomethyl-2-thiouridine(34) oxidoreductase MnmC, partial [Halioglobus sp.]|nr:FAD-dependent 5-carboxymethylaminomethyl-2-thiouridine(34) oxidoreductase MnmC [Halioglobus sp.]
ELAGVATALAGLETLAQVVAAREATRLAGVELQHGGYWYPGSGWLDPRAVCRALLDDRRISVMQHRGPVALQSHGDAWRAVNAQGEQLAVAPCAVIATGTASSGAPQLSWLPLRAIRGQTTQLPADQRSRRLDTVLCHSGYLPPARDGAHCIGASFNLDCQEPLPRREDQRHNLDALAAAVPSWREHLALLDEHALDCRVGFRCASPDYLPVAGPVPDYDAFLADYAPLRENAKRVIDTPGTYLPGLFVNTAHGSRGLTSTPMTAQLLASIICAEPPPLPRSLRRAVAPARFIIRDLGRNRV